MLILNKNIKRMVLAFAVFSLSGSAVVAQKSEAALIRERDSQSRLKGAQQSECG